MNVNIYHIISRTYQAELLAREVARESGFPVRTVAPPGRSQRATDRAIVTVGSANPRPSSPAGCSIRCVCGRRRRRDDRREALRSAERALSPGRVRRGRVRGRGCDPLIGIRRRDPRRAGQSMPTSRRTRATAAVGSASTWTPCIPTEAYRSLDVGHDVVTERRPARLAADPFQGEFVDGGRRFAQPHLMAVDDVVEQRPTVGGSTTRCGTRGCCWSGCRAGSPPLAAHGRGPSPGRSARR